MIPNTRKIGDNVFTISPMLAEDTFDLQPLLAPAAADLMRLYVAFMRRAQAMLAGAEDPDAEMTAGQQLDVALGAAEEASPIVADIARKLGPGDLKTIRRALLRGALVDGKLLFAEPPAARGNLYDTALQGRTMDQWQLLVFAAEVSYPDFFGLLGALRGPPKPAPSPSAGSTT